jgi:hypothetical protein
MKKHIASVFASIITITSIHAQNLNEKDVPSQVKSDFIKKYPDAKKITWEKEKGNFEANWGGRSGEDSSVLFTPAAEFLEIVVSIPVGQLPPAIPAYVAKNYKGTKIKEAGKVTDASGKHMYEAEIKGKDLIFDDNGFFIKED